jgi:ATP-dependent RNA helicase DDX23/PRP28
LVTTDLGGRGLDVTGVTLVVNFDAPKTIQDFIHRTGRTGRAGMKGIAITFLTAKDEELFYDVKEFLVKNNYEVPAELDNHPASRIKPGSLGD